MTTSHAPVKIHLRWLAVFFGLGIGLTTAFAGATEHGPAFALRALVVVVCVVLWPSAPALGRGDTGVVAAGLATACVALTLTVAPGPALQDLTRVLLACLLWVTLRSAPTAIETPLLWGLVGAGCAHGLWALGEAGIGIRRADAGFFQPNDLAAFVAPLAVVALDHALFRGRPHRWAWWGATILLLAAVMTTLSRAGIIAVGGGGAICILAHPDVRWPRFYRWAAAALVCLLCAGWLGQRLRNSDPYDYTRFNIWVASAHVAVDHPWGIGLGSYATVMRRSGVPVNGAVRYPKRALQAHSEPLQVWVECGWLGLLALGVLVFHLLRPLGQSATPSAPLSRGGAAGALFAVAFSACVSNSLHAPPVATLAVILAAAWMRGYPTPGPALSLPRGRWGRAGVILIGTLALTLTLPALVRHLAVEQARAHRAQGAWTDAMKWAECATRVDPFSVGAAMLVENLRFARGQPPLETSERLAALGERFVWSPEPHAQAAALIEQTATPGATSLLWQLATHLRQEAARREPTRAWRWWQLAGVQRRGGDAQASRRTLERAVEVEPRFARALAALALRLKTEHASDTAQTLAHQAQEAARLESGHQGYARQILSLPTRWRDALERSELLLR